jgi:hypothetical protein
LNEHHTRGIAVPNVHLIHYDVPDIRVNLPGGRWYKKSVMPNPSHRLWRAGAIRLSDSCWLIHEGAVPHSLVNDFRKHGVKWGSLPFDSEAGVAIAETAMRAIRKEISERLDGAAETRRKEDAALALSDAPPGSAEALATCKRYRSQLAAVTRRVRKCLQLVSHAATAFGLDTSAIGVLEARATVDAVKADMERKADAYAQAHAIIVKKRGKGDAMARTMEKDSVFGPVVADYLDEMGDAESARVAKSVRSAFGWDF